MRERDRLTGVLRPILPVTASGANFLGLPPRERASGFAETCALAGVAVRAFPGEGVRVTVGTLDANDAVLGVAAALA
ncbi:hypothetical protein [Streptomyces sp. NPDC001781]